MPGWPFGEGAGQVGRVGREFLEAQHLGIEQFTGRLEKRRKLIWRKLGKIQRKIEHTCSDTKLTQLIQDKWKLEQELKSEYTTLNSKEEDVAISNMRENPKSFFSFAKTRKKTRARICPFIDPPSGSPNPDPDFATSILSEQYQSVFVECRPEWLVKDAKEFFLDNTSGEGSTLSDIDFSESDIETACFELKSSSAGGADGVDATTEEAPEESDDEG